MQLRNNRKPASSKLTVFTVGHSNHSIEYFIELLKTAGIDAIADVRSLPFSRRYPHFNKTELMRSLKTAGIEYVFLGDFLGARPKDRHCYQGGRVDYSLIANREWFLQGLRRVEDGARKFRIALMCAEKDPADCHRTILVARHLKDKGAEILHLLGDGSIEPNTGTEKRLLRLLDMETGDLFRGSQSEQEAIVEAYHRRGIQIAYREETEEHAAKAIEDSDE